MFSQRIPGDNDNQAGGARKKTEKLSPATPKNEKLSLREQGQSENGNKRSRRN